MSNKNALFTKHAMMIQATKIISLFPVKEAAKTAMLGFTFVYNVSNTRTPASSSLLSSSAASVPVWCYRQYIMNTIAVMQYIYRLASLYGIGRVVGRIPALDASNSSHQRLAVEFETLFPQLFDTVAFKNVSSNDSVTLSSFGSDCCAFEDPKKFVDSNATWMLLKGKYYQSYKYFHDFRDEIRAIFKFGPTVMDAVHAYALDLFGNDKSRDRQAENTRSP
uniref:Peptidase_M13_N domain-containing protein n=1 Tax=Panagrellus redivivus TaxID=6233 RepID=A0A7E4UZU1_PANRE